MPWDTSDRRLSLPPDWAERTKKVHERSGRRCEFPLPSGKRCPRYADGGVDHIVPNNDHSYSNLRDSCKTHHGRKSSAEGHAAKAAKKDSAVKRFGAGPHPRGPR